MAQKIVDLIVANRPVRPLVEVTSHAVVYEAIARVFGYDGHPGMGMTLDEVIPRSFGHWTKSKTWGALTDIEYIYPMLRKVPELVDLKTLFKAPKLKIADLVAPTAYYQANPDVYLEALHWLQTFKFESLFEGIDADTQRQVGRLNKAREEAQAAFLLDPYAASLAGLMPRAPTGNLWQCAGIACIESPRAGSPIITSESDFRARFNNFSLELFNHSRNSAFVGEFPWSNVVIAGGSVAKCIDPQYSPKKMHGADIDIFIYGSTPLECSNTFDRVVEWFDVGNVTVEDGQMPGTYYGINSSVVSVYLTDVPRKIQIISGNHRNPHDIIGRFDLTHVQWAMDNERVYCTAESLLAYQSRTTRITRNSRTKPLRLIKALYYGFNIERPSTDDENAVDITAYLEDPEKVEVNRLLTSLHGWFFPKYDDAMDVEDLIKHHRAMIERDCGTANITSSRAVVSKNIVICGDFTRSYGTTNFSSFDLNRNVDTRRPPRAVYDWRLKTLIGHQLRLSTGQLTVAAVKAGEEALKISLKCTPEFERFCTILDNNTFMVICGRTVSRNLVSDGIVKFEIPRSALVRQNEAGGRAIMRDQRGTPMNIEDDLEAEHIVDISMNIVMHVARGEAYVRLEPCTVVKYNPVELEAPAEATDEPVDETEADPDNEEPPVEINYD